MAVHAQTLVSSLVAQHPYTEEVFRWHDVPLDETHQKMSLYALCWVRGLEIGQLIDQLDEVIAAEHDATEELTADEWTDEHRADVAPDDDDTWDDASDLLTDEAPDLAFESAA